MARLLSYDTAYDTNLLPFADAREDLVKSRAICSFDSFVQFRRKDWAERTRFVKKDCRRTGNEFYRVICVSTHGVPGAALDRNGEELIFTNDEKLKLISCDRHIYILACEVARSSLGQDCIDFGALSFTGFTKSPAWGGAQTQSLWLQLDTKIFEALLDGGDAGHVRSVRDDVAQQVETAIAASDHSDLRLMLEALNTMVIYPMEED